MENNIQTQKAGDHSQQIQMVNPTFVCGIDEKRVREVCSEIAVEAIKSCTAEATALAIARIEGFTSTLLPRIEKIEKDYKSFSDPDFQFALRDAQKTAACTDRKEDYEMLSELLVHRIEKGEERKVKASISKAIEIVNQIDDDALCGLTLIYAMQSWACTSGNISHGLGHLNSLFGSLCYSTLPMDFEWAYHLDMLNAVRVSSYGTFKKLDEFYTKMLTGYACIGIQKDTPTYCQAIELLDSVNLPHDFLADHELLDGYVRIPVRSQDMIPEIKFIRQNLPLRLDTPNEKEIAVLNKIWGMYLNNAELKKQINAKFMEKWNTYPNLKQINDWWTVLPHSFTITPVGKVLAHANAQRHNGAIPNMNDHR